MSAKQITLRGRFATPDDIERQIAREQTGTPPAVEPLPKSQLITKLVKRYLEQVRAKASGTEHKGAAKPVSKSGAYRKAKTNRDIKTGMIVKPKPKCSVVKKHKKAKFVLRRKEAATVVSNKNKPYVG